MTDECPSTERQIVPMSFANKVRIILVAAIAGVVQLTPEIVAAQTPPPDTPTPAGVSVFLDCHTSCDFDLIRVEIAWVDWVRDRTVADVHLLITSQDAGAGGSEVTLSFMGLRSMAARGDTLRYTTTPTQTSDESRRMLTRTIAAGLVPFVARTSRLQTLRISAATSDDDDKPRAPGARDPWRAWVFEIGVDMGLSGEQLYKNTEVNVSSEARRVTERWKFEYDYDLELEEEEATVEEYDGAGQVTSSEAFINKQRRWEHEALLVRSLTPHLSAGFGGALSSETFRNIRRQLRTTAALEYNIFPYSQSTRRQFTLQYGVGFQRNLYVDTTIFDVTGETLPWHYFEGQFRTQEPWGSIDVGVEHSNFLNNASKRNTSVNGSLDVRLFSGLSLGISANYAWIHDQIYLPKGQRDQADVLLRRRALLTGFEYGLQMGLNYTFGSIYNNVVNPRF